MLWLPRTTGAGPRTPRLPNRPRPALAGELHGAYRVNGLGAHERALRFWQDVPWQHVTLADGARWWLIAVYLPAGEQAATLKAVRKFLSDQVGTDEDPEGVILCGDFNAVSSPLHRSSGKMFTTDDAAQTEIQLLEARFWPTGD